MSMPSSSGWSASGEGGPCGPGGSGAPNISSKLRRVCVAAWDTAVSSMELVLMCVVLLSDDATPSWLLLLLLLLLASSGCCDSSDPSCEPELNIMAMPSSLCNTLLPCNCLSACTEVCDQLFG
eukprot:CAMPEP_0202350166 /NCGR_PEP_ID=MMETSP1126-20121109/7348_1 /ASSEMBLY_ACC=CAM_ASM_000457 /TAXON_ID=3047 /ORGANISM="Dunaliella tertiolecta, Strain CCMP1320" /LENGTH=122 /DNA_ID=CAMNT_0048942085 /DNA_START=698 /DNA_END=1062 /DNA_ORIENTATION=+